MQFTLHIPGKPRGKDRPRFVRKTGRTYTPKETVVAEERIREIWREVGEPALSGPLRATMTAFTPRPASHYLTDGVSLSAEGRRHPFPDNQKPDLDNVLKLCLDALNGHAFKDDVQFIESHVYRFWTDVTSPNREGFVVIDIKEIAP